MLVLALGAAAAVSACGDSGAGPGDPPPSIRRTADQPDDVQGPQAHVMYVLPQDGTDRGLDTAGAIASSVGSFQAWLASRTSLAFRLDTDSGELDITFFRLNRTDADMASFGAGVVTEIERQLQAAGLIAQDKIYLVYYDGSSTYACGGAAWPPLVPGQVAAMYLRGAIGCASQSLVGDPTAFPRYWEFAALHDLIHTLGIVSTDAPNHVDAYPAHVPEANDLMYSGPAPWQIGASTAVDVSGDDYFGPSLPPELPNLLGNAYLSPITTTSPSPWARRLEPPPARSLTGPPPHTPFRPRR